MKVFEKPGPHNTDEAILIALERALAIGAPVVASTTEGGAGRRVCELAKERGFTGPVVIVTHAYGSRAAGKNALLPENRELMTAHGAVLVTAAHALSGAERALSTKFHGAYPVEIIAHALRMLCAGVKVIVEISAMAMDAGVVSYGSPVVALGGTGRGLDTAAVLTPSYSASLFETRIHEILCKPY